MNIVNESMGRARGNKL